MWSRSESIARRAPEWRSNDRGRAAERSGAEVVRLLASGRAREPGPTTAGEEEMDERAFHAKFAELMTRIKTLPLNERHRLEQIAEEAKRRRACLATSIGQLQESLDHLRLSVKYLVFDLEATRRENGYLRKLIEQANRDDARRSDPDDDNFLEGHEAGAD